MTVDPHGPNQGENLDRGCTREQAYYICSVAVERRSTTSSTC